MMKNTDKLIIQAFLFALVQQKLPLEEAVRLELATIAENLAVKPMALHHFAVQSASLKTHYDYGYKRLVGGERIRKMGIIMMGIRKMGIIMMGIRKMGIIMMQGIHYFPGDEPEEEDQGNEIENVTRDYYNTPVSKEEILKRISANYNFQQAQQIFTAPNPVQAAQNIYISG